MFAGAANTQAKMPQVSKAVGPEFSVGRVAAGDRRLSLLLLFGPMLTESLAAELEQLLTLNELVELSRESLGLEPESLGGSATKASFARALVQRCLQLDAVPALLDAVEATGKRLSEPLQKLREDALSLEPALAPGEELGAFLIVEQLGAGPTARVYRARSAGEDVRLRVLRSTVRRRDASERCCGRLAGPSRTPVCPMGCARRR